MLDSSRRELERFLTSGIDPATHRAIGELPRGRGILGVLITDPRPLRLSDVGAHPESYGFPIDHPPMASFLGVPVLVRGEVWGNLYLTEKEGGEFDDADEEAIVVLARWAATAIQNAHLYRSERAQRTELERAVRMMETTTAITRALGTETNLDRVLELIVKRGRALVEAKSMILLLAEGDELVGRAAAGDVEASVLGLRVPVDDSVVGQVLKTGRSERLADVTSRVRFRLGEQLDASTGLLVPLVFRSRRVGVLAAFDRLRDGPEFGPEDGRLMEAFAAAAATAVAGAQDVAARDQVGARIDELRHLLIELRPAALDELGVKPALEALVERFASVNDLEIDLTYEHGHHTTRHEQVVETTIYRLVQEGLTNAAKHADARRAEVSVIEHDDAVDIRISDDGSGFDPEERAVGFGLVGMRERISLAHGTLAIESERGSGTTLRARIPVAHPEVKEAVRRAS